MKYLYNYSLFESSLSGTKTLTEDEFQHLLKTKCSDFSWDDTPIFRSVKLKEEQYYEMDPNIPFGKYYDHDGKKLRRSAYTKNYYNLLLNHTPAFSDFPKRQVICSTVPTFFASNMFRVIPFNNAKIGIVPDSDIQNGWDCDFTRKYGSFSSFNRVFPEDVEDYNWKFF